MSEFKRGDIVNITIKGVPIVDTNGFAVTIVGDHPDGMPAHYLMPPQAAVERVAPAEWPPRHKDVWRDGSGELWIAYVHSLNDGSTRIDMYGFREFYSADTMLAKYGPMVLVHREDEQDGGTR